MIRDLAPLTLEELALFNELFAQRFGLTFPDHKREILESRLADRLRTHRVHRFIDYYLLLQYDLESEIDALIAAITNNESYFFRETHPIDALDGSTLEALRTGGSTPGKIRILSAGCSSGEEPYTLNILVRRNWIAPEADRLTIHGIDIDAERIALADRAIYRSSSLRTLDRAKIERYFVPTDDGHFELRSVYRTGVTFSRGNILDPPSLRGAEPYDIVFCRNVLIYFAEPALKRAIDSFGKILRPGGLLFLGHSESIIGLTKAFQAIRLGSSIAYRREAS